MNEFKFSKVITITKKGDGRRFGRLGAEPPSARRVSVGEKVRSAAGTGSRDLTARGRRRGRPVTQARGKRPAERVHPDPRRVAHPPPSFHHDAHPHQGAAPLHDGRRAGARAASPGVARAASRARVFAPRRSSMGRDAAGRRSARRRMCAGRGGPRTGRRLRFGRSRARLRTNGSHAAIGAVQRTADGGAAVAPLRIRMLRAVRLSAERFRR